MIGTQLFEGIDIHLTAIDPEKDGILESAWMQDLRYADLQRRGTFYHLSVFEAKKQFEEMQKESEEKGNQFFFAIRLKTDQRLIGFVNLPWIAWSNGSVFMSLLIAECDDLPRYGRGALPMALAYIFSEMNLYRVTVILPEYNNDMAELYQQAGFQLEVSMRDFYYRGGRLWDQLSFGCMLENWQEKQQEVLK
jgi:RimJ/RimL family protein N-acetyltransferase